MTNPLALLNAAQIRAADKAAAHLPLMENAGRALADAICARYGARPALVVAGEGNNGGDGVIAARHLRERGWKADVVPVAEFKPAMLRGAGLVVDAIFGVGLNRAPEGAAAKAIAAINAHDAVVVAVDIPSGVLADSGEVPGAAVRADMTVTFFRPKPGLFLLPGKALAGEVHVADIGIADDVLERLKPQCFLNTPALWRLPKLSAEAHKYTRGHAVVAGGPLASTGAAKLAAMGAARAGAGLVSIACDAEALPAYAASLTGIMTKLDYAALLQDARVTALLLGPGNGVNDATRARMVAALESRKPCVLDADALTVLAQNRKSLWPLLHGACVATPHAGEFARVFDVKGDKLSRALAAAREAGCVIVLKGNDTVIAAADGRAAINANAPAWLATAGSGDVLAGIICGLLAQGMEPFAAACAGVWLHAEAANHSGIGMIAEDLPGLLPRVISNLQTC